MKNFFLFAVLLSSTLASAKEITFAEFLDVYVQNKETYEDVKAGMSAEYISIKYMTDSQGVTEECHRIEKEVVISSEQYDKYLVYHKEVFTDNCMTYKKGDVSENLEWRKRYYVEDILTENDDTLSFEKIELKGTFLKTSGIRLFETGTTMRSEVRRDMTKSQFYQVVERQDGVHSERLVKRGYTNPESINIEALNTILVNEF